MGVIVVSDVCLYREGLLRLLSAEAGLGPLAGAANEAEAVVALRTPEAAVLLIDLATPGALDTVRRLRAGFPRLRIVALGVRDAEEPVVECAEAGITGFVRRDGTGADLVESIRSVTTGELQCSRRVAGALMARLAALGGLSRRPGAAPALTPRETQVVRLVDEGLTNKEIAARLHMSAATARNHVHSILRKLGARTRSAAAATARRSLLAR